MKYIASSAIGEGGSEKIIMEPSNLVLSEVMSSSWHDQILQLLL